MKLVVESGATKSDWTLIEGDETITSFRTEGLNFSSGDGEFIIHTLELGTLKARDAADSQPVGAVYFYAAGLFPSEDADSPYMILYSCLVSAFPGASIHLENDLLAAARAVCGKKPGIVAILGTGSNTCVFDGSDICRKVSSGGFILGDEGSASALGRAFVSDYIKGLVPDCVALAFAEKYDMGYPALVNRIYHGNSPAAFLGAFAPDILSFYDTNNYMRHLVDENFRSFFSRCLMPCIASAGELQTIGVVGGFGFACRNIIDSVSKEYGVTVCKYLASPSEALIQYHKA